MSSDDEAMEGRQTRSTRRVMRVDLSKMDTASLHRYRKYYKLGDAPATATKEELLPSVSRHFAQQVVDEEETLLKFILAVQKHNRQAKAQKQQVLAFQAQQAQQQAQAYQNHLHQVQLLQQQFRAPGTVPAHMPALVASGRVPALPLAVKPRR
ncbi:hypothetical protein HYH03_005333 [Edaphochlamys debaryana]|uniref:Histone deacetylase complex subunit SAP30 Sin3 binding domain-containing protein n=1 Tax=Edaphochlamys debaryana TaxID=47281 RepID=A0A835Y834_9CHLO|nr:hypothetical protein HYH03_005333 [Edaphochlamys debaryana]|eukprot:KAG2496508.1 hypothetical protein HYH03_005333 [Edaphochlamys debaryana]